MLNVEWCLNSTFNIQHSTYMERRPLKTRERSWAKSLARLLVRWRVRPNSISILSILFAALAGVAFLLSRDASPLVRLALLVTAAAGIQLRLLCNMLDGMVAVEGRMASKVGDLFNAFPDRVADVVILATAGDAVRRAIAAGVVGLARILAGGSVRCLGCEFDSRQRIYFANHTSHLDFVLVWSALPRSLRALTRPVAAKDYWDRAGLRRYLVANVFNAVLVERDRTAATRNPIEILLEGLGERHSLIIFPEGTRGNGVQLGPFRSGLYRLGKARPDVELVPVYIDNLN